MSATKKLKPLPWPKLSEQAAYPKSLLNCQCCGRLGLDPETGKPNA